MTEKEEKNILQENSSAPDDEIDSLSEDEKAAFEKILAEINAGDNNQGAETEPDHPPQPAEASDQDEKLSDDQQVALDKIMSEINDRDQKQETDAEPDQPAETGDQDEKLSDDQQAALDKIMSEINDRDQKQETDAGSEQQPDGIEKSEITQETQSASEALSFDEFNDELDNLLSKARQNTTDAAPKKMESESEPKAEKSTAALNPETPSIKYAPAPQPSVPSSADQGSDPEDIPTSTQTGPMEKSGPAYAVLQEIDTDQGDKAGPARRARQRGSKNTRYGRLLKITSAAMAVLSIVGLVYWGLNLFNHRALHKLAPTDQPTIVQSSTDTGTPEIKTDPQPAPLALPNPVEDSGQPPRQPALTTLGSLKQDLAAARERVGVKIEEIVNLTVYYQEGIQEEHNKIRTVLQNNSMPSLEKALANSQIELSIRAIQRRHAYIAKLGAPLKQLKASSEELLFLERRAQLFETLSQWVSGPSMPQYKQEIADRIQTHMKVIKKLSVDNTQMDLPSKASVWDEVLVGLEKEKNLAANRSKINTQDKLIGQEMCRGEFGRKYQLTHLPEEAATCLIRWSGKDLYLNGLTALSPQAARILAQWPGEWLSLNGIKEISAETAQYLAQWPGKRLSLNGLTKLSPQATAQLSRWKGEQLEMIGLTVIGPWENYATRLYLSETMRRKLQM